MRAQAHLSRRVQPKCQALALGSTAGCGNRDLRVVSAPFIALITVSTTVPVHLLAGLASAATRAPGRRLSQGYAPRWLGLRSVRRFRVRVIRVLIGSFIVGSLMIVCARPAGESNHHVRDIFDR